MRVGIMSSLIIQNIMNEGRNYELTNNTEYNE